MLISNHNLKFRILCCLTLSVKENIFTLPSIPRYMALHCNTVSWDFVICEGKKDEAFKQLQKHYYHYHHYQQLHNQQTINTTTIIINSIIDTNYNSMERYGSLTSELKLDFSFSIHCVLYALFVLNFSLGPVCLCTWIRFVSLMYWKLYNVRFACWQRTNNTLLTQIVKS